VLQDKRIILGVTGSIAVYKAAMLASHLTQAEAHVDIIMTEAAVRFVTPLTFQALTGRPVYTDMWQAEHGGGLETHIAHVGLASEADLLVIAPATAQTIAKIALGLADNLLTVTALAARCPVLIAPAMDVGMFENPATQAHLTTLRGRGVHIAGPAWGRMASGQEGLGRFLEPDELLGHCRLALGHGGRLTGCRVVVTAGPTHEPIDPVRFISNHSSGKQGFALAQAAIDLGAEATLITGPVNLPTPIGAQRVDVQSAQEMLDAVLEHIAGADALLMAAAVSDFRPEQITDQKLKKETGLEALTLAPTPDILMHVAESERRPHIVVGFAAETQDLIDNARAKLTRKGLDLIVANDVSAEDAGFGVDTNRVTLITSGQLTTLPLLSKAEVAEHILDWVAKRLT
jgi:phosphopantothenoylcysteine decarboxylase/phosphopantothenate--cysteine ligase